jgi:AAA domain
MTDWPQLRSNILESFTPGPPINEVEMFAGRQAVIQRLQDIVIERGRNAIIYGERGVGKTSLATVFHKPLNIVDTRNGTIKRAVIDIHINADSGDSFDSLWRKVFRRLRRPDGSIVEKEYGCPIEPDHVFLELQNFNPNELPIIIIDEYDRIGDIDCRILMTDTIKALTLSRPNITIVLVGVADNITTLVHDHPSVSPRNLIQVPMTRMSVQEIKDIITTRLKGLRMRISDDALWRISFFSAGLPFYAHSLGKYSALTAVAQQKTDIDEKMVFSAMTDCMDDVDYSVLAACALAEPNNLGEFSAVSVEAPLSGILGDNVKVPSFAFHLNEMCQEARGNVFQKTGERRTYLYRFIEPAMQPYIIMQCLQDGTITPEIFERFAVKRQRSLAI